MKKKIIPFVILVSFVFSFSAWGELKDGMWEMTTQVEIKGMPQPMPPATFRQCITKSDPVPKNQDKSYDCKTTSQKISGNTVTYTVECKGREGVIITNGKNTYTGKSMEGSSVTRFRMQGQPEMQMTSSIKGKYIGPCPK